MSRRFWSSRSLVLSLGLSLCLAAPACHSAAQPAPGAPAAGSSGEHANAAGPGDAHQHGGAADCPAMQAMKDKGGIGVPKIAWRCKTHAQRLDYMGLFVLDRMKGLFVAWRPDDYKEFRCQTCHGENFDKPPVNFHMPRVAFPLKADDPLGGAMKYDPDAAQFMLKKVLPTMAGLLGEEPWDPATGKGTFTCFRCHPAKGGTPPAPAPAPAGGA